MEEASYFLFIPYGLSFFGCLFFLFLFFRYEFIQLSFGIKYVAILQFLDIIIIFVFLPRIFNFNHKDLFCKASVLTGTFIFNFQSCWVAFISRYTYQVIHQKVDKNSISAIKPTVISLLISSVPDVMMVCLQCNKFEVVHCVVECSSGYEIIVYSVYGFIIFINFMLSLYWSVRVVSKIRSEIRNSNGNIRWNSARLLIYPFITIICNSSVVLYHFVSISTGNIESGILIVVFYLASLSGFFNTIVLWFTPEFRDAWKLGKQNKRNNLID